MPENPAPPGCDRGERSRFRSGQTPCVSEPNEFRSADSCAAAAEVPGGGDPTPQQRFSQMIQSSISGLGDDFRQYERALAGYRGDQAPDPRVRVLLTGVPTVHGAERVVQLLECFHLPCSVITRNDRRLESLRSLAREYRARCLVDLIC